MQLVFGFEYAILLTIIINTLIKYVLHSIDLHSENPWEAKAVFMLYAELIIGFIKVRYKIKITINYAEDSTIISSLWSINHMTCQSYAASNKSIFSGSSLCALYCDYGENIYPSTICGEANVPDNASL